LQAKMPAHHMCFHLSDDAATLSEIKQRLKSFLEQSNVLPEDLVDDENQISKELILVSPKLWDISKVNTRGSKLMPWFNRVVAYYLDLAISCMKFNKAESSQLLFKGFCQSSLPIHSLTHRINLLKSLFSIWSQIALSGNGAGSMQIGSVHHGQDEAINVTLECIKAIVFLVNEYDRPAESLCNLEFIINWAEKLSSRMPKHASQSHIYYRIIFLLLVKKSHASLAQNMILKYLDYLRTVKSAPQENSQTAKFIRETLDLFISKSINTATLDFLFQIRCHSLVISASNHIFFKTIYAFKVITMIFDESFDVIMAEIAQISKNLPVINMKSLLKIVRANLLVRKNTSIISATDGGEERVTGCHTISFDELKEILSFPCSLDKDNESLDAVIPELILFLVKSCGVGVFTINSVDKTLVIRGTELLSHKFKIPSLQDIDLISRKLTQLECYVGQMLPEYDDPRQVVGGAKNC